MSHRGTHENRLHKKGTHDVLLESLRANCGLYAAGKCWGDLTGPVRCCLASCVELGKQKAAQPEPESEWRFTEACRGCVPAVPCPGCKLF